MLLSASKPFYDKNRRKMVDAIMRASYTMEGPTWDKISRVAKDFVSKLLVLDPKKRMNASMALKHPFIVNREQLPDEKPSAELLAQIDDSLVNYRQTSALKKLALNIIAHRSSIHEISELRKAFDALDIENDGTLNFEEFKQALKNSHYSDDMLEEIFSSIDTNQNGQINYTEFVAATIEAQGHIAEDRIAEAFDRLDCDDTGYISRENLKEILGESYTKEDVDAIMKWGDIDGDGKYVLQWEIE